MPDITTMHVKQYSDMARTLPQQLTTRLREHVTVKGDCTGEETYMDYMGTTEGQELTATHTDSPENEVATARRQLVGRPWVWGKLIDTIDKQKMLFDPATGYFKAARASAGRFVDGIILESALGDAKTGKAGGTTTALPAGNTLAVDYHTMDHQTQIADTFESTGNAGLTPGKLIKAQNIILRNDLEDVVNGEVMLHCACTVDQISYMARFVAHSSKDYEPLRKLEAGETDIFRKIKFHIISANVAKYDASSYERVVIWHKDALGLGVWGEMEANYSKRADKNYIPYAHLKMTYGSSRLLEEGVVEILATTPA